MAESRSKSGESMALCPGTFDPIHNGHVDVARRAARLFHSVLVGVYDKPAKQVLFSTSERVEMCRVAFKDEPRISVRSYSSLTVDYARSIGACAIVRGLRALSDFEFEYQVALMNRHLSPGIEAIFLMTSLDYAFVSSSLVKEVAQLGSDVSGLVPPHVAEALRHKIRKIA